jgi:hypothetical protein
MFGGMRGRYWAVTVLVALACNEVLGLDAGKLEGEGGGGSSASHGKGGATSVAGSDAGRGGSSAGPGNTSNGGAGGNGGEAGGAPCSTTADCIERGLDWPSHLCLAGACVDVLTEECDTVLGAEWLEDRPQDQPIVFGAVAENVDEQSASYWSLELAMREFAEHGPIPIDAAPQRPVLLLCRGNPDVESIRRRLDHLIDDVGVPGMVLIQSRREVVASVDHALKQKEADVFFIDVGTSSELLSIVPDGGRLWHMLGNATDFAPLFHPLVRLVEEHVNPGASNGNGARLTRLVMVPPVENDGFESVMARSVETGVFLNGRLMVNEPETYQKVIVREGPITAAIETADFVPDIVIDFAGIYDLIDAYVLQGRIGRTPFYILPPSQAHSAILRERVASSSNLQTRIVGVSHAGPDDEHKSLYDAYLERLATISPAGVDGPGSANVYEAVYFLVYATVAGGTGGANMNMGMRRLVDLVADSRRDIGPTTIDSVLDVLRSEESLSLHGALGQPNFYPSSGGRSMPASVWCIDEDLEYVMDALSLVPGEMVGLDLAGPFPCFFL